MTMSKICFTRTRDGAINFAESALRPQVMRLRERGDMFDLMVPIALRDEACAELIRATWALAGGDPAKFGASAQRVARERPHLLFLTRCTPCRDDDPHASAVIEDAEAA